MRTGNPTRLTSKLGSHKQRKRNVPFFKTRHSWMKETQRALLQDKASMRKHDVSASFAPQSGGSGTRAQSSELGGFVPTAPWRCTTQVLPACSLPTRLAGVARIRRGMARQGVLSWSHQGAALGIEPRTSRTLSDNHATRPSSHLQNLKIVETVAMYVVLLPVV